MSEPEIKPALTAEEWARLDWWLPDASGYASIEDDGALEIATEDRIEYGSGRVRSPEFRHALAALALHGQPFGLTHEDVRLVLHARAFLKGEGYDDDPDYEALTLLAARIAALLPPE